MGTLLKEEELLPDLIVASSAKRCRKTADRVIHTSGYRGETRITSELYEANAAKLREWVAALDDRAARVLLIAHNPGMEELLESLLGTYTPLTTAALAQVELPIDRWSEVTGETRGQLVQLWQPRELD